jgi:cold-inducible RNA-binding protein
MEKAMAKNLYVGNLSYAVNDAELEALFATYGKVDSARVITDRDTGRSKGFGFVEMSDDNEAQAAIDALNGTEHNGRTLTVNEAKPREPRSGGFGRPRGDFGGGRHY